MAADSPPEVHQWITVAFRGAGFCASAGAMRAAWPARASAIAPAVLLVLFMLSPVSVQRSFYGNESAMPIPKTLPDETSFKHQRYSHSSRLCITAGKEITHQIGALLPGTLLRRIINMNDAETALVTESPFEVIHQRPDEITADVHACLDRCVYPCQVAVQKGDAARVSHLAIDHYIVGC